MWGDICALAKAQKTKNSSITDKFRASKKEDIPKTQIN
jgi:hypothetical protein